MSAGLSRGGGELESERREKRERLEAAVTGWRGDETAWESEVALSETITIITARPTHRHNCVLGTILSSLAKFLPLFRSPAAR